MNNLEEPAGVVPTVLLHVGHTVLQDLPDRVPPAQFPLLSKLSLIC
jgi:hypothetical protein